MAEPLWHNSLLSWHEHEVAPWQLRGLVHPHVPRWRHLRDVWQTLHQYPGLAPAPLAVQAACQLVLQAVPPPWRRHLLDPAPPAPAWYCATLADGRYVARGASAPVLGSASWVPGATASPHCGTSGPPAAPSGPCQPDLPGQLSRGSSALLHLCSCSSCSFEVSIFRPVSAPLPAPPFQPHGPVIRPSLLPPSARLPHKAGPRWVGRCPWLSSLLGVCPSWCTWCLCSLFTLCLCFCLLLRGLLLLVFLPCGLSFF
jgi:hypothetical protein